MQERGYYCERENDGERGDTDGKSYRYWRLVRRLRIEGDIGDEGSVERYLYRYSKVGSE